MAYEDSAVKIHKLEAAYVAWKDDDNFVVPWAKDDDLSSDDGSS